MPQFASRDCYKSKQCVLENAWGRALWKTYSHVHAVDLSRPSCAAGKNYLVQDGDVIFFKFNVTASGKK